MTRKYNIKHIIYMKNYEICKKQKQHKINTKYILSKMKPLLPRKFWLHQRKAESVLLRKESFNSRTTEYYEENTKQVRKMQQDYYIENKIDFREKSKVYNTAKKAWDII